MNGDLLSTRFEPEDACPACKHRLERHNEDGCEIGWGRFHRGSAVDGCMCNLRIAQ